MLNNIKKQSDKSKILLLILASFICLFHLYITVSTSIGVMQVRVIHVFSLMLFWYLSKFFNNMLEFDIVRLEKFSPCRNIIENISFNQIFKILHTSTIEKDGQELPAFVLFLDGLDEITVEHQQLLDEISELSQEAKGVQVIITNTEPLKHKWAKKFKNIELMPSKMVFS